MEAEASQIPMLSPEGIKRAKGEALKITNHTLLLDDPIPEEIMPPEEKERVTWIKYQK